MSPRTTWRGAAPAEREVADRSHLLGTRFALERAWLARLPGMPAAAATLLAGRAAGTFLALLPRAEREAAVMDPGAAVYARLAGDLPPIAQLTAAWRLLTDPGDATEPAPDLAALRTVERLWPLVPATEDLIVRGGDDRLSLDPETGQNRYLCPPWPQKEVISFSSCTASGLSELAQAAAEALRRKLVEGALDTSCEATLARASESITADLLAHFGIAETAEAILAASGTDATLLLTGLFAAERPRDSMTTILMSPAETGSGVPEAVQGRHFAPCTASGILVEKGGAVEGFPPGLAVLSVALRTADGRPREASGIAADCEAAIDAALARGHAVLHAIDGSKTGLAAPDLLALDLLADRYRERLDIVVDVCQLRVEPEKIRLYLDRGWPVLITGSKFFGAPGFCGAILFPRERLRRIAGAGRLPDGLGAYASVADGSVSRRCPGLLLRWEAALSEMRRFASLRPRDVAHAIDSAGAQARAEMMQHDFVQLVAAPRPPGAGWSHRPSVLTFAVRTRRGCLSAAELRPFYTALAAENCRIGQPVQLGGGALGGLRIAFSAAQIGAGADLRGDLSMVFATLGRLIRK